MVTDQISDARAALERNGVAPLEDGTFLLLGAALPPHADVHEAETAFQREVAAEIAKRRRWRDVTVQFIEPSLRTRVTRERQARSVGADEVRDQPSPSSPEGLP